MNYTVTAYDADRKVLATHWFNSHLEARVARHKLEHKFRNQDVTVEIEEV